MSVNSSEVTPVKVRGVVGAGKTNVIYFSARQPKVTQKTIKGITSLGITIKATVDSPRTRRVIRRSVNGAFGKEKILKEEFQL